MIALFLFFLSVADTILLILDHPEIGRSQAALRLVLMPSKGCFDKVFIFFTYVTGNIQELRVEISIFWVIKDNDILFSRYATAMLIQLHFAFKVYCDISLL